MTFRVSPFIATVEIARGWNVQDRCTASLDHGTAILLHRSPSAPLSRSLTLPHGLLRLKLVLVLLPERKSRSRSLESFLKPKLLRVCSHFLPSVFSQQCAAPTSLRRNLNSAQPPSTASIDQTPQPSDHTLQS